MASRGGAFILNRHGLAIWLALIGLVCAGRAQLSPGPLANAHRDLDSPLRCTECHVFGEGQPVFVCIGCHTEIRDQVQGGKGYHSRVVKASEQGRDCAQCHRDHVGRDFQLVHWPAGQAAFDHTETGFGLTGKHAEQKCRNCHNSTYADLDVLRTAKVQDPNRSFLGLSAECAKCHSDPHRTQLGYDCERCHTTATFEDVSKFDHQTSDFPLTGRHTQVECAECHPRREDVVQFKGFSFASCKSCHEDPHQGAFVESCNTCHSTERWTPAMVSSSFDHSRTDFALAGKHAGLGCRECHTGADFRQPLAHERCLDCHDEDPHSGQFKGREDGGDCAACHTEDGFKPTTFTLEMHQLGEFPLLGKHTDLECSECHEPQGVKTRYKIPFDQCGDCHEDAHDGQFSGEKYRNRCEECHDVDGFHPSSFTLRRHQQTEFQLAGSHLAVACSACHVKPSPEAAQRQVRFHFDSLECRQCHTDPHQGQFDPTADGKGFQCETCHEITAWKRLLQFDHDRTSFALRDAHRTVTCHDCHRRTDGVAGIEGVVFGEAPERCAGCHEDVHAGQFDQGDRPFECSRCHTNVDWRPTEFDHKTYSSFPLDGAHDDVPCKMCHSQTRAVDGLEVIVYRGTPRACEGCHDESIR